MSSAARGSSNRRSLGPQRSARPIATRCLSPPDSLAGWRDRSLPIAKISTTESKSIVRSPRGANQRPNRKFCRTLRCGKRCEILKHNADAAPVGGDKNAAFPIDEKTAVELYCSPVRAQQPCDKIERQRFARTGRAKQRANAVAVLESHLEIEGSGFKSDIELDHSRFAKIFPARCWTISEATIAANEIAIDTMVKRIAFASPPGTCV